MKNKVYINGRFLTQKITGVQRVALEITSAIDKHLNNIELKKLFDFIIICPKLEKQPPVYQNIRLVQAGKFKGHFWEQLELPFFSNDGYLVNLCNVAPLFKRKQAVMIHDTAVYAWPQAYSFSFRVWYKINYKFSSWMADMLLTVSAFSKHELQKHVGADSDKIHVVHPTSVFGNITAKKSSGSTELPFVLAVSSLSPHKNLKAIIAAFDLMADTDLQLYIVGGRYSQVFKNAGIDTEFMPNVRFLGYVTDDELADLYQRALCFVYPSFYEGFGLPPLEAMSCGCPVIVSDRASLPEVCGDAALYCNPDQPETIAAAIQLLYKDPNLAAQMVYKGLEQVKKFSFEKSARKLLQLLESKMGNIVV